VVLAADDNVINPGKSCLAVPDGPVHMELERQPCISQAKGHPAVLEQVEGPVEPLEIRRAASSHLPSSPSEVGWTRKK
jgi:hypothetical protein